MSLIPILPVITMHLAILKRADGNQMATSPQQKT